jgi:hypothetical protein
MFPKGLSDSKILATADAAWRFLEREGGLDPSFYDAATVAELRRSLSLPEDEPVEKALVRSKVSVEDFVAAFFKAVVPYGEMMTDLLNLFAQASARRSDHNLRLDFDFGRNLQLGFDLNQFRDWLAVWEKARLPVSMAQWDYQSLWQLNRALRNEDDYKSIHHDDLMGATGTGAEPWVREYMEGRWPFPLLTAPTSDVPDLDRALERAWRVWSAVVQESARISHDREHLRELRHHAETTNRESDPGTPWPLGLLGSLDSDLWAASVAVGLFRTAEAVRQLLPQEGHVEAQRRLSVLDDLFARRPVEVVETDTWLQRLREFLNLPVWQRRHELYSAWVWAQIHTALRSLTCRIHQDDGTIHFSFAGSHLATFTGLLPMLHVWAELRSPLAETPWGKGRRGKIQPDYTLLHDPISSRDSAVLVVECKQYRTASARNFIAALVDYARGRPEAMIVLVNYGPAPQGILAASPPELLDRLVLIGEMRPKGQGIPTFHEAVRNAVVHRFPNGETRLPEGSGEIAETIVLDWNSGPNDLDLYLKVASDGTDTTIYYGHRGSLTQAPWAELDVDARRNSGRETITVSQLHGRYRCSVHNFSNDAPLAGCGATLTIVRPTGILKLTCPREGRGRFWHVFNFDAMSGDIEIIDRLTDLNPL